MSRAATPLAMPVASAILGRDREMEQLLALLDRDNVRVLSLLGPGGVGKTRLATELMRQVRDDFAHGAEFVALAPVRHPDLVPFAVAQALDIQDTGAVPVAESLVTWLRSRHFLLVLDNMEQVVDAAYPWLADLIAACPRLKLLVTSRIALDITGEQRFRVPPLPLPGSDATERLDENAAVALFAQRAREVRHDFALDNGNLETIAAICARLDGLPLAIELAAARINVFAPADILTRLTDSLTLLTGSRRDAPPRLRSLRDAIAWSYNLLDPDQQDLFRRLAVFVGGWSPQAAESIAASSPSPAAGHTVADQIAGLSDHSLVERTDSGALTRFRMLETIREFGIAQLVERGELDAARDAHAAYYQRLAADAENAMSRSDQVLWHGIVAAEHGNLREALEWLTIRNRIPEAVELLNNIQHYVTASGNFMESLQLMDGWFASGELGARTRARGLALVTKSLLMSGMEVPESPLPLLEEALEIFRELDDRPQIARALGGLTLAWHARGDLERARHANQEHLALARELGDARLEVMALLGGASFIEHAGDTRLTRTAYETALARAREEGMLRIVAFVLDHLAELALTDDGDISRARNLHEESLALRERLGDKRDMPFTLVSLAGIDRRCGEYDRARNYALRALSAVGDSGMSSHGCFVHVELGRIALCCDKPDDAHRHAHDALVRLREAGHLPESTEEFDLFAELALAVGDAEGAARFLCAAGDALATSSGADDLPTGHVEYRTRLQEGVNALLDDDLREQLCAETRVMSLEQAVDMALAYRPPMPAAAQDPVLAAHHRLSPRELDVLRLMATGLSNQQIADELFLSLRTVTTHVTGILGKLDVPSRTAAVAYAVRTGIA